MGSADHPIRRTGAEHLTIEVSLEADSYLMRLVGELDIATTPAVEGELGRLLLSDAPAIVVDLGGLTFIDSMGLSCLVKAARLSSSDGNRLEMLRPTDEVARTMRLVGVDRLLPLTATTAGATGGDS